MALIATESSSGPRQQAPAGTHCARCYSVLDMGTQPGSAQYPSPKRKVRISWELPDEKAVFNEDKGEQPFSLHQEYTLSLSEKSNLRHHLEAWRGKPFDADELKGFDIFTLLGVPCLLTVIHKKATNGNTYANVAGVSKLAKGMVCPPAVNPVQKYEVSEGRTTHFLSLPEWLQKKISECAEFNTPDEPSSEERPTFNDELEGDDIPPF